ncbi:MAG: hypothetical protein MZV63_19545 [Marinilabiliales bacterium]|nr:hypothetical protein [Marinilabiliales bacterium]
MSWCGGIATPAEAHSNLIGSDRQLAGRDGNLKARNHGVRPPFGGHHVRPHLRDRPECMKRIAELEHHAEISALHLIPGGRGPTADEDRVGRRLSRIDETDGITLFCFDAHRDRRRLRKLVNATRRGQTHDLVGPRCERIKRFGPARETAHASVMHDRLVALPCEGGSGLEVDRVGGEIETDQGGEYRSVPPCSPVALLEAAFDQDPDHQRPGDALRIR